MSKIIEFTVKRLCKLVLMDTDKPGLYEYIAYVSTGSKKETITGHIFKKDVKNLTAALKTGKPAPKERNWIKVTISLLADLQRYGYASDEGCKAWKNWEENGSAGNILVRNAIDMHMVFDVNDRPYPMGLSFDYVDAKMNSRNYKLKKAHEILDARPDVFDLSEIETIPYYNNESGLDKCLSFRWAPSAKDYLAMCDKCKEISPNKDYPYYHRYQAIWGSDLLGLRAGGAAMFDEYY